jgi:hypothetical protein
VAELALRLFQTIASAALALWLIRETVQALRTGHARGRYLSFQRRESPACFWLTVTVQAAFSVVCLLLLVRAWAF